MPKNSRTVVAVFSLCALCFTDASGQVNRQAVPPDPGPFAVRPGSYDSEQYIVPQAVPGENFGKEISKFFSEAVARFRARRTDGLQFSSEVDPPDFSLKERREVTVNYSIKNFGRKLVALEFPSTQRVEVLVKDDSGQVVERWSEDRAFEPSDGFVAINPNEKIQYSEKIPTREMQAGRAYIVETKLVSHEGYAASSLVKPTDAEPAPPPAVAAATPQPAPSGPSLPSAVGRPSSTNPLPYNIGTYDPGEGYRERR